MGEEGDLDESEGGDERDGEEQFEEDDVPVEGVEDEGFAEVPADEGPIDEPDQGASSTKAVCCKCGKVASNGQTVYSCSTGGSCRKCKKYGGQKKAEKVAAPTACAKGGKGAHTACRNAFAGR